MSADLLALTARAVRLPRLTRAGLRAFLDREVARFVVPESLPVLVASDAVPRYGVLLLGFDPAQAGADRTVRAVVLNPAGAVAAARAAGYNGA